MKRIDLNAPDAALCHICMDLAGSDPSRQAWVLALLMRHARWQAVLGYLGAVATAFGHEATHALVLPVGGQALHHAASSVTSVNVGMLAALRNWAWVGSDAQALALARQPQAWEADYFPTTPPSRQQWLDTGLRHAVHSDDLDKVRWWQSHGANVQMQDQDGENAVQCARSVPMLDWLLAQGAPTDGRRKWDGRAIDSMAREGRVDLLTRMAAHGADFASLAWSPLHRLVVLGSASDLEAALADPQHAELHTQLEAPQSSGRTPISYAAQQGDVRKLEALSRAGANVHVMWRDWPLGFWVNKSGVPEAMRWWLSQPGVHIDAPMGGLRDTLLLDAIEKDDLQMAALLLNAGADVHRRSDLTCPMEAATSPAMQRLLMQHGASPDALGRHGARVWLGLPHGLVDRERQAEWLLGCTPAEFAAQHTPRLGTHNGEDITSAFHVAMIESGESAYGAAEAFGLNRSFDDTAWAHVWNADRFGQSLTVLPDGRCIQIGGEHEDGYDPDFFIYNDVSGHTPPAAGSDDARWDRRVLAYPADVFPPTDSHSATLVGDEIVVIGCLGLTHQRRAGHTPVYALNIHTLQMRAVVCTGAMPGWLYRHSAKAIAPDTLVVWGGERHTESGTTEDVPGRWQLDLGQHTWTRVDGCPPAPQASQRQTPVNDAGAPAAGG